MTEIRKRIKSLFFNEDEDISVEEEAAKYRGEWNNHWEFILACIGYSVGIGNVWRFPTVCYQNGGGAFLIPYLFMLVLIGKPMYLMEMGLGQFTRQGPPGCFYLVPISVGCGYAMLLVSISVGIYYDVIMVHTMYYSFASLQKTLPWTHCNNEFNTGRCLVFNYSHPEAARPANATYPAEEYWDRKVLKSYESTGIHDIGPVKWDLCLILILSWIIVFFILFKGVKSAGKVVYVTATMPYLILTVLLVKGLTLDGAKTGILYFLKPDFMKILNPTVWQKAAGQMFFSLSVTMGGVMTYSSFIPRNNNLHRDTLIVALLDTATSLIAGFVIFSVLGFMALMQHTTVDSVVTSGQGLAFIVYPEALSRLPVPQFWSFLFFLMLFTLGIDSQIAFIETVQAALHDQFPTVFSWKKKGWLCFFLCLICFIGGLSCITRGGLYVLEIMDHYAANISLVIIGISETFSIMYIYGYQNFTDDVTFMLGYELPQKVYWQLSWRFFAPIGLSVIAVAYFVQSLFFNRQLISGSYVFPLWSQFLGYSLFCLIVLQIPIWALVKVFQAEGYTWAEKYKNACRIIPKLESIRPRDTYNDGKKYDQGHDNLAQDDND